MLNDQVVTKTIFDQLSITRIINCCGIYTDLGGSALSPTVWAAMEEANSYFLKMPDLLDQTGRVLADIVKTEAARVVPGASAAITLATAACIAGRDKTASERLPDTTGLKSEVILQQGHSYKYDRCVSLAGGKLVKVGDSHTTLAMIDAAIGRNTAMILIPAHLDGQNGTVPLEDVAALARRRDVPTFVDAAYLNYPTSIMGSFTARGADFVCFSAKYFGGPNAGGFVCGRRELIEAVARVDFTEFETGKYRKFGRPFKLDRQIVVAVVVALQEWFAMNHQARWAGYLRKVETIHSYVAGIDNVTATPAFFTMEETLEDEPVNCLTLRFLRRSGKTAAQVAARLASGDPSIRTIELDDALVIAVDAVLDGQEVLVGERLRAALIH